MEKPTLVILAAGLGSRYGSLKQMEGIGPNGEAIIDYSVYDAARAGFGKVVFIIRHNFAEDFQSVFNEKRFGGRIKVAYAFQELGYLPEGYVLPEWRQKPWGTNHAVMMAAGVVDGPFAAINADDFYGADAYRVMAGFLRSAAGTGNYYAMVGYKLGNTLSDFGTVSRGICSVDSDGNLESMVERTSVERTWGGIVYRDQDGDHPLNDDAVVSMNFFGFTPDYFGYSDEEFRKFLDANMNGANPKAEYYIPYAVNRLLDSGKIRMKVLSSDASWFGVTYKEDRPMVVSKLKALIDAGVYPENLWGK